MSDIKPVNPVLLVVAAFSAKSAALDWFAARAAERFGPIALRSDDFVFAETAYYAATMGEPLLKRFIAFERPIDPGQLAEIKCLTNDWEAEYARDHVDHVQRPLNLDPGYIDLGKFVLASCKDHAHRICLGRGIYAEVTLQYRLKQGWREQPWTFPDYRRADYQAFLTRCRDLLYACIRGVEE